MAIYFKLVSVDGFYYQCALCQACLGTVFVLSRHRRGFFLFFFPVPPSSQEIRSFPGMPMKEMRVWGMGGKHTPIKLEGIVSTNSSWIPLCLVVRHQLWAELRQNCFVHTHTPQ